MDEMINAAIANKDRLFFYSPYNFIRAFEKDRQFENCILEKINAFTSTKNNEVITIRANNATFHFLVSYLPWDTDFFKIKTYKLQYVLGKTWDHTALAMASQQFINKLTTEKIYCFIEIPSEDISLIQALGSVGFNLIETRLAYYRGDIERFDEARYTVRKAEIADIPNLMKVASAMRNDYDRFHADPVFDIAIADKFLSTYVEQSVKGFADVVMVPGEDGIASDSFLTANYFKNEWRKNGIAISKMVLSAVSADTNKGWYKKLVSEMTYHLRDEGAAYIFMNTQSTNRAVFHTWESLGYKLGSTIHILSYSN